jgi:hypothetical protein
MNQLVQQRHRHPDAGLARQVHRDHLARLLASARIQRPIRRRIGHRQRMGGYGIG